MRHTQKRETGGRRGLGPFSGTQLTLIIVTVVAVALFPVGAWAISSANVVVTDSSSGARATVNGAGALTVNEASPKTFFGNAIVPSDIQPGEFVPIATPAPGHALVITSLVVDVLKITTPDQSANVGFAVSTHDASCDTVVKLQGFNDLVLTTPQTRGATVFPFQPGIPIPAGRALCLEQGNTNNLLSEDGAYGYTVPASATLPGV